MDPHVTEPMTMATDYLLSVLCGALAVSLLVRAGTSKRRTVFLWTVSLLVAAFAALAGGTAHGFRLYLGTANHAMVWTVTLYSIGLSAVLMLLAAVRSARHPATADGMRRRRGHGWLKRGLLLTIIGLLIQRGGWGLHEHFNHNDIYHLMQMVGIYFFYRGVLELHDLIPESVR